MFLGSKVRPVRRADNLTTICENVTMWGILNISQRYRPPRPVNGDSFFNGALDVRKSMSHQDFFLILESAKNHKGGGGAKSGEEDGWLIFVMDFLDSNSRILNASCSGTLTWWRILSIGQSSCVFLRTDSYIHCFCYCLTPNLRSERTKVRILSTFSSVLRVFFQLLGPSCIFFAFEQPMHFKNIKFRHYIFTITN
jgi:hypothetical protein